MAWIENLRGNSFTLNNSVVYHFLLKVVGSKLIGNWILDNFDFGNYSATTDIFWLTPEKKKQWLLISGLSCSFFNIVRWRKGPKSYGIKFPTTSIPTIFLSGSIFSDLRLWRIHQASAELRVVATDVTNNCANKMITLIYQTQCLFRLFGRPYISNRNSDERVAGKYVLWLL